MTKRSLDNKATESKASTKQALTKKKWQTPVLLEMDYTSTQSGPLGSTDGDSGS